MIDESEFRRVVGHFATGVAVVTSCREDGSPCGMTASAVASLSLDPTLVLVCIDRASASHRWIESAGVYAVNVLEGSRGETLARRFATAGAADRFTGTAWRTDRTGSPVLEDALAWLDCRVDSAVPAGDHTIFVGEVLSGDAREGNPLLYYRGGYGRFEP
jgi:flavin reductase (DIM6/NTAB) family NADH-FMN oxidoreductase RutF